jgi:asparagine synthase (glutamine-hydrolysing)
MCAICGKLELNGAASVGIETLARMLNSVSHRGPDDEGIYRSGPVGLGHKRLKIIDLTTGRQPMSNEDGTVWVIFNGEIYNYKGLTRDLIQRGHRFKTTSDTEVIVHAYEEFGEDCVKHLRGMFSFALWDEKQRALLLARDRAGIKPLYYCHTADSLVFASEIKAILTDPSVEAEVEAAHLDRFLTYFYMPGEDTLFKNIQKLKPGHYMKVKNGQVQIRQYWDLAFRKTQKSFSEAVEELEELLSQTVRDHMISDVPVGVLLSGGVDSSGVLSFAVENTEKPVSTFTIGFDSGCTDERPYARLAANAFGARNYELTITAREFWESLPKYVWHMEEPVCEPPAVGLYFVSKLAREHVTVLLSGEGGDEAFAGYQSYRNFFWLEKMKLCLGPLRRPAGKLLSAVASGNGPARYGKYGPLMSTPLDRYYYSHSSGPYEFFNSHYDSLYTREFLSTIEPSSRTALSEDYFANVKGLDVVDQMLYVDTKTWLPDDLLIKADKMTMANSLELRVPLLDHRILEFAASLPPSYKLKNSSTKHILKKALSKRLPQAILYRKKTGFPLPYATWLSTDLRNDVAEILLDKDTIARGYFRKAAVEQLITGSARHDYSKEIFSLVTLELWHRSFLKRERDTSVEELVSSYSEAAGQTSLT